MTGATREQLSTERVIRLQLGAFDRVVRIRCNIVAEGVAQLDPPRAVFDGMSSGWGAQQHSRMLNETTITGREWLVRWTGSADRFSTWRVT